MLDKTMREYRLAVDDRRGDTLAQVEYLDANPNARLELEGNHNSDNCRQVFELVDKEKVYRYGMHLSDLRFKIVRALKEREEYPNHKYGTKLNYQQAEVVRAVDASIDMLLCQLSNPIECDRDQTDWWLSLVVNRGLDFALDKAGSLSDILLSEYIMKVSGCYPTTYLPRRLTHLLGP